MLIEGYEGAMEGGNWTKEEGQLVDGGTAKLAQSMFLAWNLKIQGSRTAKCHRSLRVSHTHTHTHTHTHALENELTKVLYLSL